MSTSELRTKLNEYRDYKTMLNELQDAMSAIEDDIKSYMGEKEELNVEGVKAVSYTHLGRKCAKRSKNWAAQCPRIYQRQRKA